MEKYFGRVLGYFIVFAACSLLFAAPGGSMPALLLLAFVLALANHIIRPILTFVALPLNLLTLGIAGVFVNMLTLLIADAIVTGASVGGFWMMALVCVCIMAVDALIRRYRYRETGSAAAE